MNALQQFIASKPGGFLVKEDLRCLIALDRLCPVLVRCGGCRFTCAAQDVAYLVKCIEVGGDYVRDASFPTGSLERAASWQPDERVMESTRVHGIQPAGAQARIDAAYAQSLNQPRHHEPLEGQDWIATGNFDGTTCGTDADSGL